MDKKTVRRVVIIALAVLLVEQIFFLMNVRTGIFSDLRFWTACTVRGYIYGRTEK